MDYDGSGRVVRFLSTAMRNSFKSLFIVVNFNLNLPGTP
jgi:hypothetical protein